MRANPGWSSTNERGEARLPLLLHCPPGPVGGGPPQDGRQVDLDLLQPGQVQVLAGVVRALSHHLGPLGLQSWRNSVAQSVSVHHTTILATSQ